jgi:hypothetical protein
MVHRRFGFSAHFIDRSHVNISFSSVFLILSGRRLNTKVDIPSMQYKQQTSVISLLIDAPDIGVDITLPEWNTHSSFSLARIGQLGRIGSLLVDGTYLFYAETHPDHVETLTLDILVSRIARCLSQSPHMGVADPLYIVGSPSQLQIARLGHPLSPPYS